MTFKQTTPRQDTKPEMITRKILEEMKLTFISQKVIESPFKGSSNRTMVPDFLIDNVLPIEVMGAYWHKKSSRKRKDEAKHNAYHALGMGYLELWDDELRKADQVRAGKIWRPMVKRWIREALRQAHKINKAYLRYKQVVVETILIKHPEFAHPVPLERRRE